MNVSSHRLQDRGQWLFSGCIREQKCFSKMWLSQEESLFSDIPSWRGQNMLLRGQPELDLQSKEITLHRGNFLWLLQRTIKPCCTWCNYTHCYHLLCLNHYYSMLGKASLSSSQPQPLTALFHSLNYESSQRKLQTQALVSGQPQPSKHTQLTAGAALFTHLKWIALN